MECIFYFKKKSFQARFVGSSHCYIVETKEVVSRTGFQIAITNFKVGHMLTSKNQLSSNAISKLPHGNKNAIHAICQKRAVYEVNKSGRLFKRIQLQEKS